MSRGEVDFWINALEADYRAAGMSGRYRSKQIHEALLEVIEDRKRDHKFDLMSYYLKIYGIMAIILIVTRLLN